MKIRTLENKRRIFSLRLISLLLLCIFCLSACGKEKNELEKYRETMTARFDELSSYADQVAEINAESDNAVAEMLTCIDSMSEIAAELPNIETPDEYINVQVCAEKVAEHMKASSENFHKALDPEETDELALQYALYDYDRANHYLQYMAAFLQGKEIEGDDILTEE